MPRQPLTSTFISTDFISTDLNVSRAYIYGLVDTDPDFPRPVYFGTHRKFLRSDYEAYKRNYIAKHRGRAKRGRPKKIARQEEVAAE
ncbi:helix-turn-helix transcriptional regulator [Phyllobacterium sp. P5_D12]